jgi:hypothetical protein
LSAAEIAVGKLAAAWLTVLAFLVAALPWLATGMAIGSIDLFQVAVCFLVLLVELAVVAAIGLGWSALINRTSGSSLMTYASVFALCGLTLIVFGLTLPLIDTDYIEPRVYALPAAEKAAWDETGEADLDLCRWTDDSGTLSRSGSRTELTWWMLAPNPFVIVADAAPEPAVAREHPDLYKSYASEGDLMAVVREGVREARVGLSSTAEYPCSLTGANEGNAVWPWGLGANLILGGLFFWIAVRRLSVPYGPLPKGTRVA